MAYFKDLMAINRENLIRILGGNNQVANTYTAKGLTEYYGKTTLA
ncbi:hypothetical protein ACXO2Q_00510 [Lactobacillus delbrueckii subsp. bulgaricus]